MTACGAYKVCHTLYVIYYLTRATQDLFSTHLAEGSAENGGGQGRGGLLLQQGGKNGLKSIPVFGKRVATGLKLHKREDWFSN